MLRRLKADVLSQLPEKRRQRIELENLDERTFKKVRYLLGDMLEEFENDEQAKKSFLQNLYIEAPIYKRNEHE